MKRLLVAAGLMLAPAALLAQSMETRSTETRSTETSARAREAVVEPDAGTAPAEENDVAATVMTTDAMRFVPERLEVRVGDTVEWRNTSRLVHTVTADPGLVQDPDLVELPEGADTFNSGNIPPGESYRHTFEVAGEYRYVCQPHMMQGMVGSVVVRERNEQGVAAEEDE